MKRIILSAFLVIFAFVAFFAAKDIYAQYDKCSIATEVTPDPDNPGGFIVGATVHYPGLTQGGWYSFVLDIPGLGNNLYHNFQVSGNGFRMAFRLGPEHAGQNYRMYIRNLIDPIDYLNHDDAWCETTATLVATQTTPPGNGSGGGGGGSGGGTDPEDVLPPIGGGPFAAFLSAIEDQIGLKQRTIGGGVSSLLNYALTIAGILLLAYLLSGGYKLMLAGGDPKKMEEGRSIVTNALIGFIIIFVAYWLVKILGTLFGLTPIIQTFQ